MEILQFFEKLVDSCLQLFIHAFGHLLGRVTHLEIRFQLRVLQPVALLGTIAHHGQAEVHRRVLQGLPRHARHGARHGHTDDATHLLVLVDPRRAVCIAVVGLADNHDGRLVVAARRHHAGHTVVDDLFEVFLATEQDFDVLVQTTAAVEAGVDDDAVAEVVLAKDLGIHITIASVTHALDVDIAQATIGQFLHGLLVVFHPTVVKQFVHRAVADGLHGLFPSLAAILDGHQHGLVAFVVEQRIVVHAFRDLHAVNLFNDATRLHFRLAFVEGAAFHHLGNLQAVALVVEVEEHAELSRGIAAAA